MSFLSENSDILNLFRLAGKPVPAEDSDMGRAVAILQTICDSQNHTIPDATEEREAIILELESAGWTIYRGNAAYNPSAILNERGLYQTRHEADDLYTVVSMAMATAEIELIVADDIFEVLESIENDMSEDFTIDFDGNEYRLIRESDIWDIYSDEIQRLVEDCYSDVLKLDAIPSFIAVSVDWEQTAKNAYEDGYGHTFSGYDGSEEEAGGYYIFRTN